MNMFYLSIMISLLLTNVYSKNNRKCKNNNRPVQSVFTSTQSPVPSAIIQSVKGIPISKGTTATLTYFDDTVFHCTNNAPTFAMAVNPLLLGFTSQEWTSKFKNAGGSSVPWCNRNMKLTVKGKTFTGVVIDTCDPVGNPFPDPNTGKIIGGKCDYTDVIDLYGNVGRNFLMNTVGDDFFQGDVQWEII